MDGHTASIGLPGEPGRSTLGFLHLFIPFLFTVLHPGAGRYIWAGASPLQPHVCRPVGYARWGQLAGCQTSGQRQKPLPCLCPSPVPSSTLRTSRFFSLCCLVYCTPGRCSWKPRSPRHIPAIQHPSVSHSIPFSNFPSSFRYETQSGVGSLCLGWCS